eukprot:TRINITY_DN139_c0_g2_i2.p1 TRINITY_DN139_c0_g2~~TRINITY_DN139_c0_g2_i2.p1  ORF type:complete len:199 (+),score=41.09 TRINITY_DN139_c0_g2_i2:342-938(+)
MAEFENIALLTTASSSTRSTNPFASSSSPHHYRPIPNGTSTSNHASGSARPNGHSNGHHSSGSRRRSKSVDGSDAMRREAIAEEDEDESEGLDLNQQKALVDAVWNKTHRFNGNGEVIPDLPPRPEERELLEKVEAIDEKIGKLQEKKARILYKLDKSRSRLRDVSGAIHWPEAQMTQIEQLKIAAAAAKAASTPPRR